MSQQRRAAVDAGGGPVLNARKAEKDSVSGAGKEDGRDGLGGAYDRGIVLAGGGRAERPSRRTFRPRDAGEADRAA